MALAWPEIFCSKSQTNPGQSRGFQAKPRPEKHYPFIFFGSSFDVPLPPNANRSLFCLTLLPAARSSPDLCAESNISLSPTRLRFKICKLPDIRPFGAIKPA
jgi:hypothetical protein